MSDYVWVDYLVLAVMLGVSCIVGIYFGCFGTKQRTTTEYLYGGRKMHTIPIGISLFTCVISSTLSMGLPVEAYYERAQWLLAAPFLSLGSLAAYYITYPVYFGLSIKSPFEYLEIRFGIKTRLLCASVFILQVIMHTSIVLYTCTIALSRAMGADFITSTWTVGSICVFYTVLGGLKTVVWTDTLQGMAMYFSAIAILVIGVNRVGGIQSVLDKSQDKLLFDMNANPFTKYNFWALVFGLTAEAFSHVGLNATSIQRVLTLPSVQQLKLTLIIYTTSAIILTALPTLQGVVMYAFYYNCDPLTAKRIQYPDQLLPLFVLDLTKHIYGFRGLFLAGIISAGLSTMSSDLNTASGILLHDFIEKILKKNLKETTGAIIMKTVLTLVGVLIIYLSTYIGEFGEVVELAFKTTSASNAVIAGATLLGMLFYKANSTGACVGGTFGMITMIWIAVGSVYFLKENNNNFSADNCTEFGNFSVEPQNLTMPVENNEEPLILYKLSYMNYTLFGLLIVFLIGAVVSMLTKPDKKSVEDELLSSVARKWRKWINGARRKGQYNLIQTK